MKTKTLIFSILFLLPVICLQAQSYATRDTQTLTLDNGIVKRVIQLEVNNNGIISTSLKLKNGNDNFLSPNSEEFYFEIDGKPLTGLDKWKLVSVENITGENNGNGAIVVLERSNPNIKISITYLLYPELPIIRKKIAFLNTGTQDSKLEALDIEYLRFLNSGSGTHCWVMNDYARQKSLGQFIGEWYDPVVVVHEVDNHRGMVLGNEAPGVMKRTTAFLKPNLLTNGLAHPDQNFGFRKWLKPGERWESTWVFTGIYSNSDDPYAVLNGPVNDYVRKYLGTRLSKITEKPVFVYNTWEPFQHNINEKLIYELVDAAAECGVEEFVIDDGWQTSYGDWGIDPQKISKRIQTGIRLHQIKRYETGNLD